MVIGNMKYKGIDIVRIPFQCAPMLTMLIALQMFLAGAVPTLQIIVTAKFIDTALSIVQNGLNVALIYPTLFAIVGLIAYTWIAGELAKFAQVRLELAIREQFRTAIVEKRAKLAYKHIENHQTWDLISRVAKNPETQVLSAYNNVLSLASLLIQVAGVLILLITQVWWATLLILAVSIPLFILAIRSGKATYEANREVSKIQRKYGYLSEVLSGREAVDERSLFGYGKQVNDIWYDQYERARLIEFKVARTWFIKMKTGSILTALLSIVIVFVLLIPAWSGAITIGMYISLVNAVFGLVQMMSWQLTNNVDQLAKDKEYMNDISQFAVLEEAEGAHEMPATPAPVFQSLVFEDVSFTYPGMTHNILDRLSFRITAGKHYAFAGINGAGKTTITKLITGLYRDFEGTILLNGKSITSYSHNELKAFYSVVYQDFAKYYIALKDNIAVGDANANVKGNAQENVTGNVNGPLDEEGLERIQAVIDNVNLGYMESKLPQGIHTPLGKIQAGGQDISGGEWQRIAMARAILNPAPLRILDEPTAALDPVSESRLYEEFEHISKDKTTLFISHRLGSTKLADEIFVIGDGRVIEHGNHHELMNQGGVYAEMYDSQRSWYT